MTVNRISNPAHKLEFDPPLDRGIDSFVRHLVSNGIETYESCQGGPGHVYPEPTVRFLGGASEGYRALSYALEGGFDVAELSRVWPLIDGELTGPYWEIALTCAVD